MITGLRLSSSIEMKWRKDMHKPYGALKKADDAIVVDSTNLNIEEEYGHLSNPCICVPGSKHLLSHCLLLSTMHSGITSHFVR